MIPVVDGFPRRNPRRRMFPGLVENHPKACGNTPALVEETDDVITLKYPRKLSFHLLCRRFEAHSKLQFIKCELVSSVVL